jgi:hypothetical protein
MKHIPNQNGGIVIYDSEDWLAGLCPGGDFSSTKDLKYIDEKGFTLLNNINPTTTTKYGILTPGKSSTSATGGTLAGQMAGMELIDVTTALGVDAGGKTWSLNTATSTLTAVGTIAGTTPVGQDGIVYRHRVATTTYQTSFLYSYYNTTNWNIGAISDVTSPSNNDTFMSGTVDAPRLDITTASPGGDGKDIDQINEPHPMEIGSDGILYIGSGRYLHAYDGNSGVAGVFSSQVLKLPTGFQIISLKKSNNLLYIAGNYFAKTSLDRSGTALVYVWNYIDLDFSQVIPLEDTYVSTIFLWQGAICALTSGALPGRNGVNSVKRISGTSVRTLGDFSGVLPKDNGIFVQDKIIYMNSGGKIITMGDKLKGGYKMNYIGIISNADSTCGVCFGANSLFSIWASSNLSGTSSIDSIPLNSISTGLASATAELQTFYPEFPIGKIGRIKRFFVQYYSTLAAAGTNGTLQVIVTSDIGSSTTTLINNLSSVSLPLIKQYTEDTSGGKFPAFTCFKTTFAWNNGTSTGSPQIVKYAVEYMLEDVPVSV